MKQENNKPAADNEVRPFEALVIPHAWDPFDYKKIHFVFSNIEKDPRGITNYGWTTKDKNGRPIKILHLTFNGPDEFQFIYDDIGLYEEPDKTWVTNFPFSTFEDFAIDLKRIGIELRYNAEAI